MEIYCWKKIKLLCCIADIGSGKSRISYAISAIVCQVRKLESQGFNAKQAEAITSAMTDVLNDCLQNVSESFVTKTEVEQVKIIECFLVMCFLLSLWLQRDCVNARDR